MLNPWGIHKSKQNNSLNRGLFPQAKTLYPIEEKRHSGFLISYIKTVFLLIFEN
jgi:hypothetical protein